MVAACVRNSRLAPRYHWLFWLPMATVVLSTVLTYFFVPESPIKAPGKVNWKAAALLSTGLAALLLAISQTTDWGWGSPKTIGLLSVGLIVMVAWVGVELRARYPLVDMTVMRSRPVWTTDLAAFLLGAGMYSSFIILPQFVETPASSGFGFGASVTGAGLFIVPSTVAMLLVGPLAGPLQARFGSRLPLIFGCGFAALGFAMLAIAHSRPIEVYVAAGLLGIGIGLAFAAMANLIVEAVPADQTGVATGVNTITRTIGGAFGGQIVATIISGGGSPTESSFALAFAVIAGSLVLSILAALAIPKPGRGKRESVPPAAVAAEARG